MSARQEALKKRARLLQQRLESRSTQETPAPTPEQQERRQRAIMPGGAAGRPANVEIPPISEGMTARNLDVAGGLAGAGAGAAAGAPLGPVGMAVGSIGGAALGTFGGSLASDRLGNEDLDYAKATENALFSLGIDTATLGAGKILKPAFLTIRRRLGFSPEETAKMLRESGQLGGQAGTPESIRQSQAILSERGATFTPFETGEATRLQTFGERIARTGLFSSSQIQENLSRQSEVVADEISSMVTEMSASGALGPEELGRTVYSVIQSGKSALQDSYSQGLDQISKRFGQATVRKNPLVKEMDDFLEEGKYLNGTRSEYQDDTIDVVQRFRDDLENAPNSITVQDLFKLEKDLQRQINSMSDAGQQRIFNSQASAELANLSSRIREQTANLFEGVSPDLRRQFSSLKDDYADGLGQLIPKVNSTMLKSASSRDAFASIGRTLSSTGNKGQIDGFFNSIDRSFAEAKRSGKDLPYNSAEEVKDLVRSSFIADQFPNVEQGFDLTRYSKKANYIERPSNKERYQAILGDKYPKFKQLMNIMSEAAQKPESNLGELVLRTKEYQGIGALASLGIGGTGPAGIAGASLVLFTPAFLAKVSTNGARVNRMLAFQKRKFNSTDALEAASVNLVSDIYNTMSESEQEDIKRSVRQANEPPFAERQTEPQAVPKNGSVTQEQK